MSSSTQDKNSSLAPFTPTLPVGYVLHDYIIEEVLGKGGFGITYLAREEMTDYLVVIKENFPSDFAYRDPTTGELRPMPKYEKSYRWALKSFEKEARTLRKLPKHPNLVHIIGVFPALNTAYIVMEPIDGKNLAELYPTGSKMEPQLLEGILHKLLSALIPMHRLGIIHRDIKPGNIMLTTEGEPVLIDFGAARPMEGTHTATKIGTREYAPPEQMKPVEDEDGEKQAPQPQPHWDLYALGCTCHQLITGRAPIHGARTLMERPALLANYPARLLSSIDKAREVAPADRWQSAQEWLDELDAEHRRKQEEEHRRKVEDEERRQRELEAEKLKAKSAQAALNAAEEKAKQAEGARRAAEEKAKQAETARSNAEEKAKQAETALSAAEEKAKQAETARRATEEKAKQAQAARRNAEEKARQAETARYDAEERARQAETARYDAEERAKQAETAHYNAEERARQAEAARRDAEEKARQAKSEQSSRKINTGIFKYTAITGGLLIAASWLTVALTFGPRWAVEENYPTLLRSFLCVPKVSSNALTYVDKDGYTLLNIAKTEEIKQLLRTAMKEAAKRQLQQQNITPEKYNIALLAAAQNGNSKLITLLITAGADVNTANKWGYTPLFWAAHNGHTECVKLLIDAVADVNMADRWGKTPLYVAALNGCTECVKLLIDAKADVNMADEDGKTPLYRAAEKGHTECVKILINAKADVNMADEDGKTPLYGAAEKGHTECVKLLIDAKADVNKANKYGYTPLHMAASWGHKECVKLLIAAGADVNKADKDGKTPLKYAKTEEIKRLLRDAGANK